MSITKLRTELYALAYFVLFATWAALIVWQVPGADDLIGYIRGTLYALTGHVLTVLNSALRSPGAEPAPAAPPNPQAGGAITSFLVLVVTLTALVGSLAGCMTVPQSATPQSVQTNYVQACASYNAAFDALLQMRLQGLLNKAQIDQVTLIDQQITPICTGPLPADPTAAAQQVTAAVTTLVILESMKKGN